MVSTQKEPFNMKLLRPSASKHRLLCRNQASDMQCDVRNDSARSVLPGAPCTCAQLCLTLCNPTDCSPPGSSVHGVSQADTLEWVAISFCRGTSLPKLVSPSWQVGSLPAEPTREHFSLGCPLKIDFSQFI